MKAAIPIFIGFDPREAVAFHTCVQSIIAHASAPVAIHPVAAHLIARKYHELHGDNSNAFTYARFLIPYLLGWNGHGIWIDGDMLVRDDIVKLWNLRRPDMGVQCVKHDYVTKHPVKYLGNRNDHYQRKNWSSVAIFNASFFPNRVLTPAYIAKHDGAHLHRFAWLKDEHIDALPASWNHLVTELPPNPDAQLLHYTLGIPAFPGYEDAEGADEWRATLDDALQPMARDVTRDMGMAARAADGLSDRGEGLSGDADTHL